MNERDILSALLSAGEVTQEDYEPVSIVRRGKKVMEFKVRPLSDEESQRCWKAATRYGPAQAGRPRTALETNTALYRSHLILAASVDDIWSSPELLQKYEVLQAVDVIDKVLRVGEKQRVIRKIDEISGFGDNALAETAKNS